MLDLNLYVVINMLRRHATATRPGAADAVGRRIETATTSSILLVF